MHYHLIGICGTAMASLAGMLQARGHKVTGSDQNVYPPMSTQLEELGNRDPARLKAENADVGADCTIVGNTISRGNAELEEVLNRKLLYRSQAEMVKEEFIRGRRSLVVAGTHGKTTTTSIAAWVAEVGGLESDLSRRRNRAEFRREFSRHRQRLFRHRRRRIRHGLFR